MFFCRTVPQLTNQQVLRDTLRLQLITCLTNSIINTETKSAIIKADIPDHFPKQDNTF